MKLPRIARSVAMKLPSTRSAGLVVRPSRAVSLALPLVLFACGGEPLRPRLVGVSPVKGYSTADSPNQGLLVASVVAQSSAGEPRPLSPSDVSIECGSASCRPLSGLERPGHAKGSLAILVDASGSNEVAPPTLCTGCPTDKERQRVEAVKRLIEKLHGRAPGWRISVFDFGPKHSSGMTVTRQLAGYTTSTEDLVSGADALTSSGGTTLFDAIVETLPTVATDARLHFEGEVGRALLVVSDGEDTESGNTLEQAASRARELGIAVDAVGFGPAGADGLPIITAQAMRDLRQLATESGGYVSILPTGGLVDLFDFLSQAYDVGLAQAVAKVEAPPEPGQPLAGTVSIGGSEKVEFLFLDAK